ncbi:ATP-binding protein [Pseudoroseomonas globiformis]|uniref:histidine kinase n=1 Tax=Teichococcus globiformis TaxID=2307229 RepID=A0ABV7FY05_9PROT
MTGRNGGDRRWPEEDAAGPSGAGAGRDPANRQNLLQLAQLRMLATLGQVLTIGIVEIGLGVRLPLHAMAAVVLGLVAVNLASLLRLRLPVPVHAWELMLLLLLDVLALAALLFFSGGVTNPFVGLFLLQVTLAAVLLPVGWAWTVAAVSVVCVLGLGAAGRPLALPPRLAADPFQLYLAGFLICFVLVAALLVAFVTRMSGNLRDRDLHLAELRRRALEEEHIVRMGLLASGAAHELGTPLATLSVILGDWRRLPQVRADAEMAQDVTEMQGEVARCKEIISGILVSAGEARGEGAAATTLGAFLRGFVEEWNGQGTGRALRYDAAFGPDVPIAADPVLKQVLANLVNNAGEAGAGDILLSAAREGEALLLTVSDDGPGFAPAMLERLGTPYSSTKGSAGGTRPRGLGLFLVANVARKLGGAVSARNRPEGGASVTLSLPLPALIIEREKDHGRAKKPVDRRG